jgi:tyrosine-protein kinase Etk/Wzc
MNTNANKDTLYNESNLFDFFRFNYFPYWPLFVLLVVVFLSAGLTYLKYATPQYESTAEILIKDEKKGTDDSRMLESLNIYTTKKIVEDEIQVLQSLTLSKEIVKALNLNAPFYEEGKFKSLSAYTTTPVNIQIDNYDSLFNLHEKVFADKVYLQYNTATAQVTIDSQSYPLNEWVVTKYGKLKFIPNIHYTHAAKKPIYFSLVNPKVISNELVKRIDVSEISKLSSVVKLSIRDEVPQRGEDILNELTRTYNNAGISDKNQLATNTLLFVKERLNYVKKELDSIENQVQRYKSAHGVVDLSQQSTTVLKNVGDNNQRVADVHEQLAVLKEIEKYVSSKDNKVGIVPSTLGVNDAGLSQLLQKLYDSEINYERLKKTIGENNPMVTSLSNEIERVRPAILENIHIQQVGLQASLDNLNATNSTYSTQLQGVPEKERGLLEITRQEAILNNVYSFLLQKREETALSYASTVPDSRTVNVAETTIDPVSPKKIIVLGAALGLALFLGLLMITAKDIFNNKILFRKDIEKLTNVPVIGEISNTKKIKELFVLQDEKRNVIKEEFRQLRTAIGLYGRNITKKKLMFTSGISGEGKSFISANMALSLALSGKKVVLLDFDLRNPEISYRLGINEEPGIAEYLESETEPYEIIKQTFCEKLFVIGAGNSQAGITDLSFNNKLGDLFEYLAGIFDFIIIDTPPVKSISDAYIITQYCDASIYIARHNYTPKVSISLLEENSRVKPLKNLALIFNGVKSRGLFKKRYGIEYGYGYENFHKAKSARKRKVQEVV